MVLNFKQRDKFKIKTKERALAEENKLLDTLKTQPPPTPETIEAIEEDHDQFRIVHSIPRDRSCINF